MKKKNLLIGLIVLAILIGVYFRISLKKVQLVTPTQREKAKNAAPSRGGAAIMLTDGRVLITGGYYIDEQASIPQPYRVQGNYPIPTKNAEIFNPKTNVTTKISDMIFPHAGHKMFLQPNGKVLIVGGEIMPPYINKIVECIEIFNPKTNKFSYGEMLKTNYSNAFLMPDGKILIVGTNKINPKDNRKPQIEIYDPKTNKSKIINEFNLERQHGTITSLNGAKILIFEGSVYKEPYGESEPVMQAEIYDYSTNTVSRVDPPTHQHKADK